MKSPYEDFGRIPDLFRISVEAQSAIGELRRLRISGSFSEPLGIRAALPPDLVALSVWNPLGRALCSVATRLGGNSRSGVSLPRDSGVADCFLVPAGGSLGVVWRTARLRRRQTVSGENSGRRTGCGADMSPQDVPVPAAPAIPRRTIPPCVATDDQGPPDSFHEACTQTQGPPDLRAEYDALSHRDLHELCKQRCYARMDSKPSLFARLRKIDDVDSARGLSVKQSRVQQDGAGSRELVMTGRQP